MRDPSEDLRVDGRTILKWILRKWDGGMDWLDLAQDRDRRRISGLAEGEQLSVIPTLSIIVHILISFDDGGLVKATDLQCMMYLRVTPVFSSLWAL